MSIEPSSSSVAAGNADQARAWNGAEGASWAAHAPRRPDDGDLVGPLLDAAAARPGDRVLDVGCGTGGLTCRAAAAVAGGEAIGIDLSALMIERARREAELLGIDNASFVVGDAQVHPFAPGSFDLVLSHFGAMFFEDPVAAFANLAAALRPHGRLLFVCPQQMARCDWYRVPLRALTGHDPAPSDSPSAMFSLAEAGTVTRVLTTAGLTDVQLTPIERSLWFGATAWEAAGALAGSGPVRALMQQSPGLDAHAREQLAAALREHERADGVWLPGAHWLVEAARPEVLR